MNRTLARLLLRLYPRWFRDRWRAEVLAFLGADHAGARERGGVLWRFRFWLRASIDAVTAAARVRGRAHGRAARGGTTASGGAGHIGRGGPPLSGLGRDVWYSVRRLIREPGFHAVAVGTMALGIAATTAVFSVLHSVVLRPLPYPSSDRLVQVGNVFRGSEAELGPLSHPELLAFMDRARGVERAAGIEVRRRVVRWATEPVHAQVAAVSLGFFDLLGAGAGVGRLFGAPDHDAGAPAVAVLPYGIWVERYGAAPDIVGSTISVDGRQYAVVGVVEPGFILPDLIGDVDLWTALYLDPAARGSFVASGLARMRPGVDVEAVSAELNAISAEQHPDGPSFLLGSRAVGLREVTLGDIGATLWLLLGGVTLLLAIACTNVANLMLARGSERITEVGVRKALGASRPRIARQLITESVVLALAGGFLGALLAMGAVHLLRVLDPGGVPRLAEVAVDARVLVFTVVVSALTGAGFGILPAFQATRRTASGLMRGRSRTVSSRAGVTVRRTLVVAEVAMALILTVSATLLVRSFVAVRTVDTGFRTQGLAVVQVELGATYGVGDASAALATRAGASQWTARERFFTALVGRVRAIPGVRSAAISGFVPFAGFPTADSYTPEGYDIPPDESVIVPEALVGSGFAEVLGVEVTQGREFDAAERARAGMAVMVNEAFARAYWPGEATVVGKRIKSGSLDTTDEGWFTVVGVLSDVRDRLAADPTPTVYHPFEHEPGRRLAVLARTDGDAAAIVGAMRQAVQAIDAGMPVMRATTVEELAASSVIQPRFYSVMAAAFGSLALALALIGIYGTASYAAARRTREIGIRLALGAREGRVTSMFVTEGLVQALMGVVIGITVALVAARALERYLFGVSATDAATFAFVAGAVAVTAVVAAWLPARRAVRLDPMATLKHDR